MIGKRCALHLSGSNGGQICGGVWREESDCEKLCNYNLILKARHGKKEKYKKTKNFLTHENEKNNKILSNTTTLKNLELHFQ